MKGKPKKDYKSISQVSKVNFDSRVYSRGSFLVGTQSFIFLTIIFPFFIPAKSQGEVHF